jgi:hypothetical protein
MRITSKIIPLMMTLGILALPSFSQKDRTPFSETLYGQGRSCSGPFRIFRDTLTWNTPLSHCLRVPYKILKRDQDGRHLHVVYELTTADKKCQAHVVDLEFKQPNPGDALYVWQATGYLDNASWKKRDQENSLSCLLF